MDWWWYVLIAIVIVVAVVLLLRARNPGVPGSGTADPPRDEFSTDRPGAMDADDREDDDAYMRDRKIRERDQPPPPPAG